MYKRIELHNHTVESDGKMTAEELAGYFHDHKIYNFSLTDHNTVSGHKKLKEYIRTSKLPLEFMTGYELTSYYGHILCQNVSSYIPWDDIDIGNADLLLERVHHAGGLAGIAHPFSMGAPVSNGMEFRMKIHNHQLLDFIEIINNAHSMIPDNYKAILWWENLVTNGYRISAVSGMDFHKPFDMNNIFTTYIEVPENSKAAPLAVQFEKAIAACKTCVTKGPIIESRIDKTILSVEISYAEDGFSNKFQSCEPLYLKILLPSEHLIIPFNENVTIDIGKLLSDSIHTNHAIIIELYEANIEWQRLLAVGAPIFPDSQF
jgi:hypothetical protein